MSRRPFEPRRRSARLVCEALESRELLNGSSFAAELAVAEQSLPKTSILSLLPSTPTLTASTVPDNGDLNPYGVAVVPRGFLVSNFDNSDNLQGTGTTILRINRDGSQTPLFQGEPGIGLTSALGVLHKGYVLVGSVPTTDGTSDTVQQGSLLIINRFGQKIGEVSNETFLNGPWGLTVNDQGNKGQVFISNVLNGTVTRLNYEIKDGHVLFSRPTQIASGFATATDPAALVIGPTGLAYDKASDSLFVASTGDNEIFAIPHAGSRLSDAGTGNLVYQDDAHLHGPLGLILAPNGDLITTNGDAVNTDEAQPSELVEFTRQGQFVDELSISDQLGAAFGIAMKVSAQGFVLATVNDADNTLEEWKVLFHQKKNAAS
jgi:hypothetical protein